MAARQSRCCEGDKSPERITLSRESGPRQRAHRSFSLTRTGKFSFDFLDEEFSFFLFERDEVAFFQFEGFTNFWRYIDAALRPDLSYRLYHHALRKGHSLCITLRR